MNKTLRNIVIVLVVLIILFLIVPFAIPVPPLTYTISPLAMAQEDSHFATLRFQGTDGIDIHYREKGSGPDGIILLHGFGGNVYNWNPVIDQFPGDSHLVAYDRIPFGLSERIVAGRWSGANPYSLDAAVAQLVSLMDEVGIKQTILVGHSAGGLVALKMALEHPDRVRALILVDPAVYSTGGSPFVMLSGLPQYDRLGPLLARYLASMIPQILNQSFHNPDRFTTANVDQMAITFKVTDWDRALWEYSKAQRPSDVVQRLGEIKMPVLIITGDDDKIVPMADQQKLAQALPDAKLEVIAQAGHIPFIEQPVAFMQVVDAWLKDQGFIK